MSSHREAPQISKDPVADSTDVYAFVSPDAPDTVTLISNYIPLEGPDGGPNFYEFGDDVLYQINIDNDGDGVANIIYQFQFTTTLRDPSYLPLQRRTNHELDESELEQGPDVLTAAGRRTGLESDAAWHESPLPALQRRTALHAELCSLGQSGHKSGWKRHSVVRRTKGRGVLRGPRSDLRPRQPEAVPR